MWQGHLHVRSNPSSYWPETVKVFCDIPAHLCTHHTTILPCIFYAEYRSVCMNDGSLGLLRATHHEQQTRSSRNLFLVLHRTGMKLHFFTILYSHSGQSAAYYIARPKFTLKYGSSCIPKLLRPGTVWQIDKMTLDFFARPTTVTWWCGLSARKLIYISSKTPRTPTV